MKPEHQAIVNQAHAMDIAPSELASELLQRDLIETTIGLLRKQKAVFSKLPEQQQEAVIREVEDVVAQAVKTAITIIAAKGTVSLPATLKQITVDKSLKAVLEIDSDTPHRHSLIDAAKHLVLLVLAPHDYGAATDTIKAEKDQPELPLDGEALGIPGIHDNLIEVTPYELALAHVVTGGEITPKAIQAKVGCKKKEAGELVLELQANGIVSEPDDDGHRTLLAPLQKPAIVELLEAAGEAIAAFVEAVEPVTVDDGLYADACALVIREKRVSVSFLKSELAVDEDIATALINRMEADGVVSEENDMGGRAVYD